MSKKVTKEQFIERAIKIHNSKYNYDNINYINTTQKINIMCPIHGEFTQSPSNHLNGRGCRKCGLSRAHFANRIPVATLLKRFKKTHNARYIYPTFSNNSISDIIIIICPKHGEFKQTINAHLSGHGCPECANVKPHTTDSFIKKVEKIHNYKYDYSLVHYINNNTKVKIICPEHGIFEQTPRGHLTYNCPKCHIRGYSKSNWIKIAEKNKHASLYVIECYDNNESFIKIGITSKTLKERFRNKELPYSYKPIIEFDRPPDMIWDFEKELHKACKYSEYIPQKSFAGMYECFTWDAIQQICYIFPDY